MAPPPRPPPPRSSRAAPPESSRESSTESSPASSIARALDDLEDLTADTEREPGSPGPRHFIAVGSGKGGVGKSLIAANLAIYLAQLGKRVVLLDADLGGANLHTFVGVERPHVTLGDFFDHRVDRVESCIVDTQVANLGLLSAEGDPLWAANPKPATKNRLISQVQGLDVDYLICDLPSGSGFNALDFFLVAHVGMLVVVPEPTSVENTWRFIKSAFLRRLRGVPGLEKLSIDRASEGGIPSPLDLYHAARDAGDGELAGRVLDEIHRFRPRLVVNQTRSRADLDLGQALRAAGRRRLGLAVDYLGHLETDDAVWLAVRKRRPLIVEHPEAKVAKNLERIVRRLLALESEKTGPIEVPRPTEDQTLYEVLEIDPGASDEEIRRAYKRVREMYASDSMVVCGLFSPELLDGVHERIEVAYDVLLDPERRKRYDLELFPEGIPRRPPPGPKGDGTGPHGHGAHGSGSGRVHAGGPPTPPSGPHAQGSDSGPHASARGDDTEPGTSPQPRSDLPEPTVGPDTEWTGGLLRAIREARGIDLGDIAQRTKIGITHLRSIEDERWELMPALVYLRGFVVEYARTLKLDSARVSKSYLERFHRARPARDA